MTSLAAAIAQLAPITLDELNARAALLRRTDRKYILTEEQFLTLLATLQDDVRVLEIDGDRNPRYESLYFDTPDRQSFRAAAHKRRRRFKVRTRSYVETEESYLEVKLRDARRRTLKLRLPYAFADRDGLDDDGRAFVRDVFAGHGLDPALVDRLVPTLHTRFRRTTLLIPSADCRVTVDTGLTFEETAGATVVADHLLLLETKSDAQNPRVDRLLWRMGIRPSKVSKFAIGSALLDPTLPDNKWARTIARHFASPSPQGVPHP